MDLQQNCNHSINHSKIIALLFILETLTANKKSQEAQSAQLANIFYLLTFMPNVAIPYIYSLSN